jgi:hypothetical protein
MHINITDPPTLHMSPANLPLENVDLFKYLGAQITADNSLDREIGVRLSTAAKSFAKYKYTAFRNDQLSLESRIRLFQTTVVPALLYAAETWTLTTAQKRRLEVAYNKYVRDILNIRWWQHRTTEEVLRIADLPPFERYLASRTLRWYGHVRRSPPNSLLHYCLTPRIVSIVGNMQPSTRLMRCVNEAINVCVKYYPYAYVPHAEDIVLNQVANLHSYERRWSIVELPPLP